MNDAAPTLTDDEVAAVLAHGVPMAERMGHTCLYLVNGRRLLELYWEIQRLKGLPLTVPEKVA